MFKEDVTSFDVAEVIDGIFEVKLVAAKISCAMLTSAKSFRRS